MLAGGVDDFARQLRAETPHVVVLYEDNFNFLSKMCLAKMRAAACEMAALARAAGSRVIAAGPDVTDAPRPYLDAGVEIALAGEGLPELTRLLSRLAARIDAAGPSSGADLPSWSSAGWPASHWGDGVESALAPRRHGAAAVRPMRSVPNDSAPDPIDEAAWDLVDIDRYRSVWQSAHGYFSLNLASSRGCSFRCAWCAKPTWGNRYLQRAPAAVAEEMSYLKQTFRPDHIWFADDIFGFRVDWVRDFAAEVAARDAFIPFTIQTRADLVSPRMAEALRTAGCIEAWIGAESGSQKVLDAMNKGTTVALNLEARERLGQCGIRVGFFIQLGYPDEELEDILATRALLDAARPDDVGISVSYPLPGTPFYQRVKAQLGAKTHWQHSGDLEMMFHGTYTSDFYRAVRDLLHEQIGMQDRGDLEKRWERLLSREREFRSAAQPAALGV